MAEKSDNPLERILDDILGPGREEDVLEGSQPSPDKPPPKGPSAGTTSRAARFEADDAVIKEILRDMAELSADDLDTLHSARLGAGEFKPLDLVARETGLISFEQQEAVFRSYLERRVEELREALVGAQIGSYSVIDELGRGGMGIVFKARQESPMFTREVALKFMLAGTTSEQHDRERFVSEVKGLAGLSHPFLVPIFDSGIEGDLYYFSMEYIDGSPLSDPSIASDLTQEQKVGIVRDIARALDYLHKQGVVHRDVKPGNIMVDRHGNAKLLDFGIAQFSADPRRRVAQAGTPFYMAPEVIDARGRFGSIGPGTDIYALGAVLYKLLTGREVFPAENDVTEVFRKTLREEPSFSTTRRRIVHPDLERIMRRCLRKRVTERYESAGQMADELDRFLRPGRHRPAHLVGAAILLVLAVLAVVAALREDPAPPVTAEEQARMRIDAANEKIQQLKGELALDTLTLPGDVERWLVPGMGDLTRLASSAGTREDTDRFEDALETFQKSAAGSLQTKAREAREAVRNPPYLEENPSWKLWDRGNEYLDIKARAEGTSASALRYYLLAIELFGQVKRKTEEAERLESARKDAQRAGESSARARREVENVDLSAISAEADRLFDAGEESRTQGDLHLTKGEYERASAAFRESERLYHESGTSYQEASKRFAEDKARLWEATNEFLLEFTSLRDLYLRNVPVESRTALDTIRQESDTAFTEIDAARTRERLGKLEARLTRWKGDFDAARRQFEEKKEAAESKKGTIARVLAHPELGKLPITCKELIEEAKRTLQDGNQAFAAQDFRGADKAFSRLLRVCKDIFAEKKALTDGMQWIDGGRIGGRPVPGFWIDSEETTVEEFSSFRGTFPGNWKSQQSSSGRPVVGVPYGAALEFAAQHGKTLPDLDQWELALPHLRDSELFDAAEWVRPRAGAESSEGILTHLRTKKLPQGQVRRLTLEDYAGFRCVLEARSWEETPR